MYSLYFSTIGVSSFCSFIRSRKTILVTCYIWIIQFLQYSVLALHKREQKGWEIADGLYVAGADCIDKPNFGWPNWNERSFDEIELVGLCTDICVVSNALILKAQFPDVPVSVDASCCAGVTPDSHEAALITMKMCQIDIK